MIYIGNIKIDEDDLDLLECLVDVEKNGQVFIFDKDFQQELSRQGYISINGIGWTCGTSRLRSLLPKLKKTLSKLSE